MDAGNTPESTPKPQPPFQAAPAPVVTSAPSSPVAPVAAAEPVTPEPVRSFNSQTGFPIVERPDAEGATVTLTHLGPAYEVADGTSGKVFSPGVPKKVTQEDADRLMAAHPFERWQVGEPESAEA
jgi:hypothetical protein